MFSLGASQLLISLLLLGSSTSLYAGDSSNSILVLDCQKIQGIPKFLVKGDGNSYHFPQDRVFEQLAVSLDGFKEFRTPYQSNNDSQILAWSNEASNVVVDAKTETMNHEFSNSEFSTRTSFQCQKMSSGFDTTYCEVERKVSLSNESADSALKPQEASGSCAIKRWKICDYLSEVKKSVADHRESDMRGPAHSSWKIGLESNHILQLARFLTLKYSCSDNELAPSQE